MIVPEGGAHLADGVAESLLCLADGTFGARATLEEDEAALDEAMLVGGCYRPAAGVGEDLRPLPGWWDLPLPRDFPPGERLLDLRDGTLWRNSGHGLLRSLRFACAARPGVGVLVAWVHPALLRSRAVVPPAGTSSVGGGIERAAWSMTALAGSSSLRVERIVAHARGDGHRGATGTAAQRLTRARAAGSRGLLAEQRQTWARRWQDCDIEVTGDLAATRALRFAMFHLQSSAPDRGVAAVGARGLTGPAYAGHVLWDTDVFVLPFLAAARPEAARAVLQYRIARLGPARRRAAEQGPVSGSPGSRPRPGRR
jgi:trehalose/maltose hydrolase-like predicted phosphorylase